MTLYLLMFVYDFVKVKVVYDNTVRVTKCGSLLQLETASSHSKIGDI